MNEWMIAADFMVHFEVSTILSGGVKNKA